MNIKVLLLKQLQKKLITSKNIYNEKTFIILFSSLDIPNSRMP